MLYVFEIDGTIYVSSIDPDSTDDLTSIEFESIIVEVPRSEKMPSDTKINIVRNVLSNCGCLVTIK